MRWEPLWPWWGIVLLLLPLMIGVVILVVEQMRRQKTHRQWNRSARLLALTLVLLLCGLGPSVPGDKSPAGMINLDVVIAVDRTPSMSAEDYDTDKQRLDGVRSDIKQLAKTFSGARITMITFGESSQVVLPFTTDTASVTQAASVIDQEISLYVKGTSIDRPIETIQSALKKSERDYPTRGRLLFYFGDGEQTVKEAPKSFASLKTLINGGAVLGYGTQSGGKMPEYYGQRLYADPDEQKKYLEDPVSYRAGDYTFAISRINEKNLQTIASDIGVSYQHRTKLDQPIKSVIDASKAKVVGDTHRETLHYMNLYWLLSVGLVGLLGWWIYDLVPVLRQARMSKERSL